MTKEEQQQVNRRQSVVSETYNQSNGQDGGENGDIHVITENGEQCFMWRSNQLTYIAQDRQELPHILASKFGHLATKLDLSYNTLTSFENIGLFTNLSELVLDNNSLVDDQLDFSPNLRLKTLSLNKNKLKDLHKLISSIKNNFPNLEFLSLIGNPLCPEPLSNHLNSLPLQSDANGSQDTTINNDFTIRCIHDQQTEYNYEKYRLFIIYHLPNLRFLDSSQVTSQERDLALKRCYWMSRAPPLRPQIFDDPPAELVPRAGELPPQSPAIAYAGVAVQTDPIGRTSTFQMTIMSDYVDNTNGLDTRRADGNRSVGGPNNEAHKGAFSRLAYKYTGKNSEGNRFIRNQDL